MAWLLHARNPNDRDILIGVPHTGRTSARWAAAYRLLDIPMSFAEAFQAGQPIDLSRNIMVSKALQMNALYLFFIDSDILVRPNTLRKLWECNLPIAAGPYLNRGPPYELVANIDMKPVSHEILKSQPNSLFEVEEAGCGCMLIDTRVFKRMSSQLNLKWRCLQPHGTEENKRKPTIYGYDEAENLGYKCKFCQGLLVANFFDYCLGKSDEYLLSEDYYFCYQARKVGFQVYLHTAAVVTHESAPWDLNEEGLTNTVTNAGVVT